MLTPSFTASQNFGSISTLQLVDTSSGSDASITGRLVYITDSAGNAVVPTGTTTSYVLWPIADTSISINVLSRDFALFIRVVWVNGSTVSTYAVQTLFLFKAYSERFLYNLTQYQTSNPKLVNSNNFYDNKCKLRELVDSAAQAVEQANDIQSAQLCLNLAKEFLDNKSLFY